MEPGCRLMLSVEMMASQSSGLTRKCCLVSRIAVVCSCFLVLQTCAGARVPGGVAVASVGGRTDGCRKGICLG